jgi:hypothetical protein
MATVRSRTKAAGLGTISRLHSERSSDRDPHMNPRNMARKAIGSNDWRKPDTTEAKPLTTRRVIPVRIHTISGDFEIIDMKELCGDDGSRQPRSRIFSSRLSSASSTKICVSSEEISKLTASPLTIQSMKPVMMEDTNGQIKKVPDTFACEVTTADIEYITGGVSDPSLSETQELQSQGRFREPPASYDIERFRDVVDLATSRNDLALILPRRTASNSPGIMSKRVDERCREVDHSRRLEKMMEVDPAIQCINGFRSQKHRRRPAERHIDRFDRLCGRLHPSAEDESVATALLEHQERAVQQTVEHDNSGEHTVTGSCQRLHGPYSSTAIDIENNKSRLDPKAAEFQSFVPSPKKKQPRGKI